MTPAAKPLSIPLRLLAGLIVLAALASCGAAPRGGPVEAEILAAANDPQADFAVYPVTRAALPMIASWPATGPRALSWIGQGQGDLQQRIRPGDSISLRIWDSGDNSLLTAPEQRSADLADALVSPDGTVFVPYIGKVAVAGKTLDEARADMQRDLEAIVPSAQLQLTLRQGRGNSVDLVGGVARPGSYPLPDPGLSVMGLLAAGGGVSPALNNPQIRLVRGQAIHGTSIERLYANPALDTPLRGGDRIFVEEDRRSFLSLGAAGTEAIHPFPKETLTAIEALAIIGGVNDTRADPRGILVLRDYPQAAVGPSGPRLPQVVFTLDLTTADGLFAARHFAVQPGDLVMATESPVANLRTVFGLIGSAFGILQSVEG
ncbi:MAG: polysaccharide export protein [Rhodobacteraceae bacterium]|nr:MAG: polysaccharide export protein [Paracoccaceae bacterium]